MRKRILHPFLFAAYPVLALLAYNIEEIKVQDALRSLGISILITWGIYWLLSKLLKNPSQAGLITTLGVSLFYSYGQIYHFVRPLTLLGIAPGRHRLLLPLWIGLFIVGIMIILRRKQQSTSLTQLLNLTGIILVAFPVMQIGLYSVRSLSSASDRSSGSIAETGLSLPDRQATPDIYYIILDAYARDDTLHKEFGLNNEPFLQNLEKLGFYVARCSQSNYAQTRLSLSSSLNMNYLQELGATFSPGNTSRIGITGLVRNSAVRQVLDALGYTSIAFETGFKGTQWEDADIYLSPGGNGPNFNQFLGGLTSFEEMLLSTSVGAALIDSKLTAPGNLQSRLNNPNHVHYDLIRFDLEELRGMPARPGPKLVFAHLVIPHPPYVFEADGQFVDYDKPDNPGYRDQVSFLNNALIPILQQIITQSATPPIIVVQADHGAILSPPGERMNILNAYYLPGVPNSAIAANISPVNTFRLIFNRYFSGSYALLENTAYFSVYNKPYEFRVIPNNRKACP